MIEDNDIERAGDSEGALARFLLRGVIVAAVLTIPLGGSQVLSLTRAESCAYAASVADDLARLFVLATLGVLLGNAALMVFVVALWIPGMNDLPALSTYFRRTFVLVGPFLLWLLAFVVLVVFAAVRCSGIIF